MACYVTSEFHNIPNCFIRNTTNIQEFSQILTQNWATGAWKVLAPSSARSLAPIKTSQLSFTDTTIQVVIRTIYNYGIVGFVPQSNTCINFSHSNSVKILFPITDLISFRISPELEFLLHT